MKFVIWKKFFKGFICLRKQNPNFKETTEEFLSRWHPDDRLVPVITVTIYFGNDGWDAAKSLQEMFIICAAVTERAE